MCMCVHVNQHTRSYICECEYPVNMRSPTKLHDGIITHHIAGVLCLGAQGADDEAAGHWRKSRVPGEKGTATSFTCKERNEEHRGALEKRGKE